MSSEFQDAMINSRLLTDRAYKDTSRLDKRKDLYQYTYPYFNIEDEVLGLQYLEAGQSLLDVGCGTGKLLLKAATLFPDVRLTGLDISSGMFQAAQKRAIKDGLNINFQTGDVQSIQFPDDSFDRVVAMHMLYHVKDIHKALAEIARVVKPEGMALITANSGKSRAQLRLLKVQAAKIMGREVFTDPNMRFNLERGLKMVAERFKNVSLVPFESTLRLTDLQPYVDYFDSLREFWQPAPTDEQWSEVLNSTKKYIEHQIITKGEFTDRTGFGTIVASDSPIPHSSLIENKVN